MGNYYHWLLESTAKLLYLKEFILDRPEYKKMKILVPPRGTSRTVDQTYDLPLFQSLKDRFIYYDPNKVSTTRYYFSKGLYIIDWIHPKDDTYNSLVNNVWSVFSPPQTAIMKVHDFFNSLVPTLIQSEITKNHIKPIKADIIYLSRQPGKNVRSFPNENEWLKKLKSYYQYNEKDIENNKLYIHTGQESLLQQKVIFHTAKVVLGAHGAGITNMIFANKNTKLIMIPMNVSRIISYTYY